LSEGARTIVINMRRGLLATPHKRRAKKAIDLIRAYVRRHFKGEEIVIDQSVNESIWKRGSGKPPSKITVEVEKDEEGRLIVRLP
jgi:large subunit ribosomal protein L31e